MARHVQQHKSVTLDKKTVAHPAYPVFAAFLKRLLPGATALTQQLRDEILDFCFDMTARTAFISGPVGAGKSTVARMLAMGKRLALLKAAVAERLLSDLRFSAPGLISEQSMHWYVELPLTGIAESVAEAQLFGTAKGFATGVGERPGIFELAQNGRGHGDSAGVQLTKGVVFLDEICDLSPPLQAKLLPVLSGGIFHRLGAEDVDISYRGTTVSASWQDPRSRLRQDLVSRITDRIIHVPGIPERGEDVAHMISSLQTELMLGYTAQIEEALRNAEVDRYWAEHSTKLRTLSNREIQKLCEVNWSRHGHLRGLSLAIRQVLFAGKTVDAVIQLLPISTEAPAPDSLLQRLFDRKPDGTGLASHVKEIERGERTTLRSLLEQSPAVRGQLFQHLGIGANKSSYQLQQLDRSRKRNKKSGRKP